MAAVSVACQPSAGAVNNQPGGPTLPTPLASSPAEVQSTQAAISSALAPLAVTLAPPANPYRPSEPIDLTQAPRVVLQESLPDANTGFVVIYDLPDAATAARVGQELASYLGGGFGQTNYPLDAQFAVNQLGSTLVFTWWSAGLSSNDALAQNAFNAIAGVGQAIPVTK